MHRKQYFTTNLSGGKEIGGGDKGIIRYKAP